MPMKIWFNDKQAKFNKNVYKKCTGTIHLWHDSEGDMKISSYKMFFESELIFKPTKPSCHELFIIIVPRQCKLKFNSQENAQ